MTSKPEVDLEEIAIDLLEVSGQIPVSRPPTKNVS
jgi:hypothetical protein